MSIYSTLPVVHCETLEYEGYVDYIEIKKVDIDNPVCAFNTILVPSQPDMPMLMSRVEDALSVWPQPRPLTEFQAARSEPLIDVERVFTTMSRRGVIPYDTTYAFVATVTREIAPR